MNGVSYAAVVIGGILIALALLFDVVLDPANLVEYAAGGLSEDSGRAGVWHDASRSVRFHCHGTDRPGLAVALSAGWWLRWE